MRLLASLLVAAAALASAALAQSADTPELKVTTTFPSNPLSLVKNGQANRVVFNIQNPPSQDRVLSLTGITGAWLNTKKADGEKGRVIRNMTLTPYKSLSLRSVGGRPLEVPFDFYPEFKPQTMGVDFYLKVLDGQTQKTHSILAYQGSVTVIEPPKNWLDPQLWSLYLLGLALLVGGGYYAATLLVPGLFASSKTGRSASTGAKGGKLAAPLNGSASTTASNVTAKSYDEDWIPEHHLRKSKAGEDGRKSPTGSTRRRK